jgi:putative oxidoreductase
MARFTSTRYTHGGVQFSLLVLRVGLGLMMLTHGWPKLMHFSRMSHGFSDPLHLTSEISLALVVFAEVFCAVLLILGFYTRAFVIPLLIEMGVIIFMIHQGDGFGRQELAVHFFLGFLVILILGPGKISLDGLISGK